MSGDPFDSEAFHRNVELLIQLHRVWDDKKAAEAVRDAMDEPWEQLTEEEEVQLRGLSSDLNWVRRGPAPHGPRAEDVSQEELIRFATLVRSGELGAEELRLMRRCYPRFPPASIAYRRGWIWAKHGYDDLALIFYEHAAKLEPNNLNYPAFMLDCLARVNPDAALKQAREAIAQPGQAPLGVVVQGMALLLASWGEVVPAPDVLESLTRAADAALWRLLPLGASEAQSPHMLATACLIGGLCHLLLEQEAAARRLFDVGVELGAGRNHDLLRRIAARHPSPRDAQRLLGFVSEFMETSLAA